MNGDDFTIFQLDIRKKSLVALHQSAFAEGTTEFHASSFRVIAWVLVQAASGFNPLKSPAQVGCLSGIGYAISGFFPTVLSGLEA